MNRAEKMFEDRLRNYKPEAAIIGANGNIFNLLSICIRALEKEGLHEQVKEMPTRVYASQSYEEALRILLEYITPVEV